MKSEDATLFVTGFSSPGQDLLTLVVVNPYSSRKDIQLGVTGASISGIEAFLSQEGDYYQQLSGLSADEPLAIPAKSVTTVVLDL